MLTLHKKGITQMLFLISLLLSIFPANQEHLSMRKKLPVLTSWSNEELQIPYMSMLILWMHRSCITNSVPNNSQLSLMQRQVQKSEVILLYKVL